MYRDKNIALIMPAKDEAAALPVVLSTIPRAVDQLLVVNNGSTDNTAEVASKCGAYVIEEPRSGYGRACLAGLKVLEKSPPDIVAFADADGSDDLARIFDLMDPLLNEEADLVLGKRIPEESGALSLQQRFGNRLATFLIKLLWGYRYEDLGPMRVIKWASLQTLEMSDQNYGWTIEMQIRALQRGLRIKEIPVPYRRRVAGSSKVSRNLSGSLRAGIKIIWVIFRELLHTQKPRSSARQETNL
jgi:glycosyltransferase involved in cell wall biosynthesis